MQPEIRFTPFEYISPAPERRHDCLRVNFDFANATLKARLKAFGMRWAREGKYFYFMVPEGVTDQKWADELKRKLGEAPSEGDETVQTPTSEPIAALSRASRQRRPTHMLQETRNPPHHWNDL